MRSKVSESGVNLPKEWFKGAAEVDIRREEHCVIVRPVQENDPCGALLCAAGITG
jgi:virulence-associated protein VagC